MNQRITVNYEGIPAYDIILEQNFSRLSELLAGLAMTNRRFMIITDTNVGPLYCDELKQQLLPVARTVLTMMIPAGEANKNLNTVNQCYEQLILAGFDRNDVLVALGGGVVGDLTGFVAASYLRGVRFIQVPTSLLAMVDSSIGGKTGVDYKEYKNMVGAFHQPKLVYMNVSTLLSLPDKEYYSGMGEIIKHGLIKDSSYYQWLKEKHVEIGSRSLDTLVDMISKSCLIKKEVVEIDPKEKGERALLNFGHTIGHSVEKLKGFTLLHGECVCIGMAAAAYLSFKRGYLQQDEYEDILTTIKCFHQPINTSGLTADTIYEVSKSDKKMDLDKIRFILLKNIGQAVIDSSVTKEELTEAIQSILC
jgi:3-dehydroquinate synthase